MAKPDISIIIVNWKVRAMLEKCLNSLRQQRDLKLEILVVDNDSDDGTSEMIIMEYPEVRMIALARNIGFAAANNLAYKQCRADYILLLNPDTQVKHGALSTMRNYLHANSSVGVVGPKILNYNGSVQPSVRHFPDFASQALVLFKLKNIWTRNYLLAKYLSRNFDYRQTQAVEQIMGAAMMIKRELIEQIGLFDKNFFMWFEEVDFCLRVRRAGWQVVYLAEAEIFHQAGASFDQSGLVRKQLTFDRSLLYYFAKHKPFWQWLVLLLLVPVNLVLTILYAMVVNKEAEE